MFWPLLLLGSLFVVLSRPKAPAPPPLLVGASPRATRSRPGETASLEFGAPYQIVAGTASLSPDARRRLFDCLRFGTFHASNIRIESGPNDRVSFCFIAPNTERAPIGRTVDVDLGEAKARLTIRSVTRLDGRSC